MKDKNPNDNLWLILTGLAVILIGILVGSHVYTERKLNETYTTRPTVQTHGSDELVEHKPRFKITFEPIGE